MQSINKLDSALCDMYDIKRALSKETMQLPKDNDGTEITISDCIDDIIDFLEELEIMERESQLTNMGGNSSPFLSDPIGLGYTSFRPGQNAGHAWAHA